MRKALLCSACILALATPVAAQTPTPEPSPAPPAAEQAAPEAAANEMASGSSEMRSATGSFISADGQDVGTATLTETPHGVLVDIDATGMPAGEHGFHIHETGTCDPADQFESAGEHYAGGSEHGYMPEGGPHAGDMPNQFVQEDGILRAHVFNPKVTLGEGDTTLFDDDGSAIVVHADPDDYESQPSGETGDRLACAVIEQQ